MRKQYHAVTAEEAVKVIKSGDHVHISSVSNVPQCLVKALCDRGSIPIFMSMKEQHKTIKAGQACLTALGLFLAFFFAGDALLKLFGISSPCCSTSFWITSSSANWIGYKNYWVKT